jgi:hypothetical protein
MKTKTIIIAITLFFFAIVFTDIINNASKARGGVEVSTKRNLKDKIESKIENFIPEKKVQLKKTVLDKVTKTVKETIQEEITYLKFIDDVFTYEEIDELSSRLAPKNDIQPVSALSMEHGVIKSLEVGDTIVLPVVGDIYYKMEVSQKTQHANDSISIDGTFKENGISYTAILTEGDQSLFVSMTTPQGAREVEVFSGLGYMYDAQDIQKIRINPTSSDTVDIRQSL